MWMGPTANPVQDRARPEYGGFVLPEMSAGRAGAIYALTGWYMPGLAFGGVYYRHLGEPDWSGRRMNLKDATGAVIGVRSGRLIPLSDQVTGPLGIDGRDWAGEQYRRRVTVDGEEDWLK